MNIRRAGPDASRTVPRRKVIWLAAPLIVTLGVGSVLSRATSFSSDVIAHNDLTQDYVSVKAWFDGVDPYSPTAELVGVYLEEHQGSYRVQYTGRRNPHPPLAIVLVSPLGSLTYRDARLAWLALMSVLLALSVALTLRTIEIPWAGSIVGGVGSLALPIVQLDLIWAQINGFVLFLLVLGWRGFRRGSDAWTGVCLGLASAIKFYPLIFALPLLRARRFAAVAWQVGTAAATSVLAIAIVGWGSTTTYLRVAAPGNLDFWRAAPMNLSLVGLPFRWLSPSAWQRHSIDLGIVSAGLALVLMAVCAIAAARTPARASRERHWAVTPWMLLAAPLAWPFTLTLCLPYLAILWIRGYRARGSPPLAILVPTFLIIATPIPGLPIPGPDNSVVTVMLGFGLPTYALIWLGIAEWRVDLRERVESG